MSPPLAQKLVEDWAAAFGKLLTRHEHMRLELRALEAEMHENHVTWWDDPNGEAHHLTPEDWAMKVRAILTQDDEP
jgi:ABC-type phosphate transport system auxiliary subunit